MCTLLLLAVFAAAATAPRLVSSAPIDTSAVQRRFECFILHLLFLVCSSAGHLVPAALCQHYDATSLFAYLPTSATVMTQDLELDSHTISGCLYIML